MIVKTLGEVNGRGWYFVEASLDKAFPDMPALPAHVEKWQCVVLLYDADWHAVGFARLIDHLMGPPPVCRIGGALFHGRRCADAHDLADLLIWNRQGANVSDDDVALTTWHSDETADEVLYSALMGLAAGSATGAIVVACGTVGQNASALAFLVQNFGL